MIDVVYVVRPDEDNEELRYSLRSLANLPHDRVLMFGGPSWVRHVERVPFDDPGKWGALTDGMHLAAERLGRFVLMNDDFYIMRRAKTVPVMHRGPLDDHHGSGPYSVGRRTAYKFLVKMGIHHPMNYELHAPMAFKASKLQRCFDMMGGLNPNGYVRSYYGNLCGIGGAFTDDFKYGLTPGWPPPRPFLSTEDGSFRYGYVGDMVRAAFPEPSVYE